MVEDEIVAKLRERLDEHYRSATFFLGSIIVLGLFSCALAYCNHDGYENGLADGKFIENCAHHDGEAHRAGKDKNGYEIGPFVCQHITPAVVVIIPLDGG